MAYSFFLCIANERTFSATYTTQMPVEMELKLKVRWVQMTENLKLNVIRIQIPKKLKLKVIRVQMPVKRVEPGKLKLKVRRIRRSYWEYVPSINNFETQQPMATIYSDCEPRQKKHNYQPCEICCITEPEDKRETL